MYKEFIEDIEIELQNLERLIEEMDQIINEVKKKPDFIFIRAAGSITHDFYCGVEKIFQRIANNVNNIMLHGEDWHSNKRCI